MPGLEDPIIDGGSSVNGSGYYLNKIKFIRDLWKNNSPSIVTDSSLTSIASRKICDKLNQLSGHINFNSTNSGFYATIENTPIIPSNVSIYSSVVGDHANAFRIEISINDVIAGTHFYTAGETEKTSSINFSESQAYGLMKLTGEPDQVRIRCLTSGSLEPIKVKELYINYSGNSYNTSYSSPTPDIYSFYPTNISGKNLANSSGTTPTNPAFVSGPTNTSGADATYIYNNLDDYNIISGVFIDANQVKFGFNTSGVFYGANTSRNIDKIIFSMRYNNASGDSANIQDFSSVNLYSPKIGNIGYGSGFHIHNTSGYSILQTDINYIYNNNLNKKNFNTNFLDYFEIGLNRLPPNVRVSAVQADLYLNNDNVLAFNLPASVSYSRGNNQPLSSDTNNIGNNRLKENNFDTNFFNITFNDLNTNQSLTGSNLSIVDFWKNYYESKISSYQYHNHAYNNSLYLRGNQYISTSFNSSNYTLMLQCSTSGDYPYLNVLNNNCNLLTKYDNNSIEEFQLKINNGAFNLITKTNTGNTFDNFDSYSNNIILITKENLGFNSNLKVYISDGVSNFSEVVNRINNFVGSNGELFIGSNGSVSGFNGYIHSYGISSNIINIDDFQKSRFRLSSVLANNSGIGLKTGNISGNLTDRFQILFNPESINNENLYQYNTPMIFANNTWLTNPSAYSILLNYTNNTNNPSGMIFSGYYVDMAYTTNNEKNIIGFKKTIPSGAGLIEIFPSEYSNINSVVNTKIYNSQYFDLFLNSPNNINHSHEFKINSMSISFDGWYLPQTGIQNVSFVEIGSSPSTSNFDLYLKNIASTNILDFYTQGSSANNNFVNFRTLGTIFNESGISFYTDGQQGAFKTFNMYLKTPELSSSNPDITFYVDGKTPELLTNSMNYYVNGTNQSGVEKTLYFKTNAELDYQNSIPLYITSISDENEDSINFVIASDGQNYKMFNMSISNQHSGVDYGLDYSMYSAYNMSGNLNMVIK